MPRVGMGMWVGALLLLAAPEVRASTMVVVAHPDDDIIMAAGVTHAAALRGERVTVVYLTNGELIGGPVVGLARQAEAVTAQAVLGIREDDLMFLGYPDNRLRDLWSNQAFADPGAVLVSAHGQSVTAGNRGRGRTDYHAHRFGMHASFNRRNVLADLVDLVDQHRPTQIITHADFDVHPDHSTTSAAVRDAVRAVVARDSSYVTTIHHGPVWTVDYNAWPAARDPTTYFTEPPGLAASGTRWVDRQSIDVPRTMQSTVPALNPKHRAVEAHVSQGGTSAFIGRFIHKDEVFWSENPTGPNRPPYVNAGPSLTVAQGAAVQLDGSLSRDPDGPLTYQWTQRDGAAVVLAAADTPRPTFTATSGNTADEVVTFGLVVSDGVVQSLEDRVTVTVRAGSAAPASTNLAPRAKASASTQSAGQGASRAVDEMVAGWPKDPDKEWVTVGERAGAWLQLDWPQPCTLDRVVLHDRLNPTDHVTGLTLVFDGGVTRAVGPLDNQGAGVTVTFPPLTTQRLRVVIEQTGAETVNAGLAEVVVYGVAASPSSSTGAAAAGSGAGGNLAVGASASASTPASGTSQDASKAVDGVVDGWPNDYSKEWVTKGERVGAWLQLEWPTAQLVERVVLFDRPNPTDHVTGALLTFSDGSTVKVSALDNAGGERVVKFPPRKTTRLRVTVTSTSKGTENVGLSEVQVYGAP